MRRSEKKAGKPDDAQIIEELNKLGVKVEMEENKEETILNADVVISSPGIPPESEVIKLVKTHKIPLMSEIDLALRKQLFLLSHNRDKRKPITTKLISEILTQDGYNAPVCGNIGIPAVSLIEKRNMDISL
ncbi:MAG: hypothetical protein MZU79_01955 [Anaerotruncus sp.]|nr:hypothetical protein [Anaerotruncus sp.]